MSKVRFIEEIVSGRVNWRKRKLGAVVIGLNKGGNLIVPELSRLRRSMLEIMEILNTVKDKRIDIYAIKGNWQLNDSIQSKVLTMAFSMAAEIKRDVQE